MAVARLMYLELWAPFTVLGAGTLQKYSLVAATAPRTL
jgi:hypothetical protein